MRKKELMSASTKLRMLHHVLFYGDFSKKMCVELYTAALYWKWFSS